MTDLPLVSSLDLSSFFSGVTLIVVIGWLASIFELRKNERAVQIEQITTERAKWRGSMRKVTDEIATEYHETNPRRFGKVAALRARLVTSINPNDDDDEKILIHFDELFAGTKTDLDIFTKRIALLLKHDWERVKWECMPIYKKIYSRYSAKQREWRKSTYREVRDA
jgi:hypothetical protein